MNTKIAPARLSDAEALAEMSRTLIENGLPQTWTAERIRTQIRHPECAVIVAKDGRRLAGFASMQFLDEHAHLALLAVRGGYRQRGIGRALAARVRERRPEDARPWIEQAVAPCLDRAEAAWPPDFSARAWAASWINE